MRTLIEHVAYGILMGLLIGAAWLTIFPNEPRSTVLEVEIRNGEFGGIFVKEVEAAPGNHIEVGEVILYVKGEE